MAFEEEFGSEISDSEAEKILTVGDAIKFIEKQSNLNFFMSSENDGSNYNIIFPVRCRKTTLVKKLSSIENFENINFLYNKNSRLNEVNGKDYYFINTEDFNDLIKKNELLEYAEVFSNFYGSSKNKVIDNLKLGKNVIFDIDWQGTKQIKEKKLNYKLISIFILPPSKKL